MRKELHAALVDGIPEVQHRVYPLIMPQDTKKNSIVYRVIAVNSLTGITCTTPISQRFGVQIDVFAHTYAQSVEIMDKVEAVLRSKFLSFTPFRYEDYANITVKYRQILDVQLEVRPVFTSGTPPTMPDHIVNHGNDIYNHGNLVIN